MSTPLEATMIIEGVLAKTEQRPWVYPDTFPVPVPYLPPEFGVDTDTLVLARFSPSEEY